MSPQRRLRWALHAFPRRFRAQRCAEIESTFQEADLAGDPKAYGTAALIDVVVAGWRERARTRPPLGSYLKYRLLAGRLVDCVLQLLAPCHLAWCESADYRALQKLHYGREL